MVNFMPKNKQILMICVFLTVAALMAFRQVSDCDFINYDDNYYVTKNKIVQDGITLDGIQWAFTANHAANWHPLTWISHMLDVQLFGLEPQWHHLMNLLFHLVNTVLLFLVLHRMTKALWQSAFVAALFALHPLHVESVAWVAERKDVLSAFFWILTMGAYCYYVERPKLRRYLIVVVFFALGLMAKPMLVTLPLVLLLLDYWPLQRFRQIPSEQKESSAATGDEQKGRSKKKKRNPAAGAEVKTKQPASPRSQWALVRPLLWEKIPLFALTALSSIVTYIVQQKEGAVASFASLPIGIRIANAFVAYITYIGKTIWPSDLAIIYVYPHDQGLLPVWQVAGAAFLLTAITILVIWKAGRIPYATVGWLWYAGTLVPVIGIVQVGLQPRADRYTYLPLIGLFIIASWGIPELLKKWRYRKEALVAASLLALACLCIVTWMQVRSWKNSITLFEHAIKVTDRNYAAYYNLGHFYSETGNYRQAIGDYDKAIEFNPKYADAYVLRGNAWVSTGDYRQAIVDYDKALAISPKYAEVYYNRGISYWHLGNVRQAIEDYGKALELNPKYVEALFSRGNASASIGEYRQAIGDYDKAVEISPNYAEAYFSRGYTYSLLGNGLQSSEDLKTAARLGHKKAQTLLKSRGTGW